MPPTQLPQPTSQPVQVSALPTGRIYLPERWLFEDGDSDVAKARVLAPDFSFLVQHSSGQKLVFDLGLRKARDIENHPYVIANFEHHIVDPQVPEDAHDLLSKGPAKPDTIDTIVLSHVHFDHTGDCRKFPRAQLIVGPGTSAIAAPGYPKNHKSPFPGEPFEHPSFRELSLEKDTWVSLPHGLRGHDLFGDGSFYLVDTPGHMPGHLSGLARTGEDEWLLFGGDCCHHRDLLVETRPMSVTVGPGPNPSFHKDPVVAKETMAKIRALEDDGSTLILLAHDALLEGVMPEYPASLNNWKTSQWKKELDAVRA